MSNKVKLVSSDEEEFEADKNAITLSVTIRNMLEDVESGGGDGETLIPLPNVTSKILKMVIEYCQYHTEHPSPQDEKIDPIGPWDTDFLKVDNRTIFELILAANYLDIKKLLDLTCYTVANTMIKGKTPAEIRKAFEIKNEMTPEEEDRIMRECEWIEEK
eukprot:TRINITY_DN4538_c0_g1_i1.p1 TRINITY_DN4538_c0_g1~~TRINITY_DN4538_c0_g1_i1.p1  ORF type:complete len:160 (+),score=53.06 TRINITY_DN4538_c0_g1_i1:78-557(+)